MSSTPPRFTKGRYERPIRWRGDLLSRHFAPRQKPLPAPAAGIFDEPHTCIKLNLKWASHILGVLETLIQEDAWLGDEDEIFRAQQEVEKFMAAVAGNEDACMCCCEETNQLLRQLIASNNSLFALQVEQMDDGTVESFAPDAPDNWTGNAGQSSIEQARREAALCRAIDRLMISALTAVHDFLVASGVVASFVLVYITPIAPLIGFAAATFVTLGAIAFETAMNDQNAQRRVRCCIFDNLKNAGEISFEAFKNAASGCDFEPNSNEIFIAEQIMRSNMSVEANYRAFVRILNGEFLNTSDDDNGDDCVCCDDTPTLRAVEFDNVTGTGVKTGTRSWTFTAALKSNGEYALMIQARGECCFCVKSIAYNQTGGGLRHTNTNECPDHTTGAFPSVGLCTRWFNLVNVSHPFTVDIEICDGGCEVTGDCVGCD